VVISLSCFLLLLIKYVHSYPFISGGCILHLQPENKTYCSDREPILIWNLCVTRIQYNDYHLFCGSTTQHQRKHKTLALVKLIYSSYFPLLHDLPSLLSCTSFSNYIMVNMFHFWQQCSIFPSSVQWYLVELVQELPSCNSFLTVADTSQLLIPSCEAVILLS
jgi:hypothetical protein